MLPCWPSVRRRLLLTLVRASREGQAASRHWAGRGTVLRLSLAGLLLVGAPVTSIGLTLREQSISAARLAVDRQSVSDLRTRLQSIEGRIGSETNWTAIASAVQASVFTIATTNGLGSGWVARSGSGGSEIVTNFHVV